VNGIACLCTGLRSIAVGRGDMAFYEVTSCLVTSVGGGAFEGCEAPKHRYLES
jgi:hypothetical protein